MTRPAIIAGIGCRRGCPGETIIAVVRRAQQAAGHELTALAAPGFKRHEPGLRAAADALGLPLLFVAEADLSAVQAACPTRSDAARRATGLASVAEAAALAASGGRLLLPRIKHEAATCAVAGL